VLSPYGLTFDSNSNEISGWIKYNTCKTTQGGAYDVQIETAN